METNNPQATLELVKNTVEFFREQRKKRSLEFVQFQFKEFADKNNIPETLRKVISEAIANPDKKIVLTSNSK